MISASSNSIVALYMQHSPAWLHYLQLYWHYQSLSLRLSFRKA